VKAHAGIANSLRAAGPGAGRLKSRTGLPLSLPGLVITPAGCLCGQRRTQSAALEALAPEFARWQRSPRRMSTRTGATARRPADTGRYAVLMLASALALALVAITFNTIRCRSDPARRNRGRQTDRATDGYIQRPFLYLGSMIGCVAGGLADGLERLLVSTAIAPLGELYGMPLQLAICPSLTGGGPAVRRHARLVRCLAVGASPPEQLQSALTYCFLYLYPIRRGNSWRGCTLK